MLYTFYNFYGLNLEFKTVGLYITTRAGWRKLNISWKFFWRFSCRWLNINGTWIFKVPKERVYCMYVSQQTLDSHVPLTCQRSQNPFCLKSTPKPKCWEKSRIHVLRIFYVISIFVLEFMLALLEKKNCLYKILCEKKNIK